MRRAQAALVLQVFDEFLTQLGEDIAGYVRTVCHTIVLTVPKAIIHCQVASNDQLQPVCWGSPGLESAHRVTRLHPKSRLSLQPVDLSLDLGCQ